MTETSLNTPSSATATAAQTAQVVAAFAHQRLNMLESQVRPSDITDRRILRAMAVVPREAFVPETLKAIAYMDNPIILERAAPQRVLMEPRLFAKLLQLAEIPDGGRVLEVGSATGYGVAVLAAMGCKAFGLEDNVVMAAAAEKTAARVAGLVGVAGAQIKTGPLAVGLAADGPFDAIIFSGSVQTIPPALFDQLKNGGRLVAVTGNSPGGKATVWTRSAMTFAAREAFDAAAAPLPGFARQTQSFVF